MKLSHHFGRMCHVADVTDVNASVFKSLEIKEKNGVTLVQLFQQLLTNKL